MTKNNVSAWLSQAARQFTSFSSTPNLEAQLILAEALQKPREWLLAHPDSLIPEYPKHQAKFLLHHYLEGEPLPYILQRQEFYGLTFRVTSDVLIPRPETELLVEYALDWLISHQNRNTIVDVGTGCGCIAVSLAVNSPNINLLAVDLSLPALEVAKFNAQQHQVVDRIQFIQSDLLSATSSKFDLICANLPYIPTTTLSQLAVAGHEPLSALDGGVDGLRLIEPLLDPST